MNRHGSLVAKIGAARALIVLAEILIDDGNGAVVGGFAFAWITALSLTRPAICLLDRRDWRAGLAAVMVNDPSFLAWVLFWTAVSLAALLPLPGFGAVFLRVYENTLFRQTEAELVAQGAALSATAAALWPAAPPGYLAHHDVAGGDNPYSVQAPASGIDLSTMPIRAERPPAAAGAKTSPDAAAAAARISPIMDATRSTTRASILLLDRNGSIVAGNSAVGSYAALPEVVAALAGSASTVLRHNGAYRATYRFEWLSLAAAVRVHYARPIIVGDRVVGVLLLSRSVRAMFRGLYEDRGKIALGITAIFGLLVVLSGVISRGVTRPIEQLGAAMRAVASGRGRVSDPPPTAAIEIQDL